MGECGICQNKLPCDHVTGLCIGGCANGWTGEKCKNSKLIIVSAPAILLLIVWVSSQGSDEPRHPSNATRAFTDRI